MSISTDEHVDLGDKNLVHGLEIFRCANNADAGMLAAAIAGGYTIGATYGIVRFQVGVNASDQVWCVRTFSDAQAVKYDVSKMVTTFQGPGAGLAALMTGIEYRILAPASEAAGLAAHYEASGIYDEVPYDPHVFPAQFYKLDSGYNSALSKQNSLIGPVDKCVVTEEFTLGSPQPPPPLPHTLEDRQFHLQERQVLRSSGVCTRVATMPTVGVSLQTGRRCSRIQPPAIQAFIQA